MRGRRLRNAARPDAAYGQSPKSVPPCRLRQVRASPIDLFLARETAAGETAEPLVERDVHGVEESGDFGGRAAVVRRALPEAGAVEMNGRALRARERDLPLEVGPLRQAAPDLPLWKLEQDRGQPFADAAQVVDREQSARLADRDADQAVQALVGPLLVEREMAGRVEGDRPEAPPLGMDAQRDLLRHRARGHEDRGGLAEDGSHLVLQGLDRAAGAVAVDARVDRDLGQELRGGPVPMPVRAPARTSRGSARVRRGRHGSEATFFGPCSRASRRPSRRPERPG